MFFSRRGRSGSSLFASVAAYGLGILLAGSVAAAGFYRVTSVVLAELTPVGHPTAAGVRTARTVERGKTAIPVRSSDPRLARQAHMTPLHARVPNLAKSAEQMPQVRLPAFFGSSSRYFGPSSNRARREDDEDRDDEEKRPRQASTYRTLCVRLCDGYYFPISFSTTSDRLGRDAKTCERSCGGQARLFFHLNPGAEIEDMKDLRGQAYSRLGTAFLYRTQYVANCKCQPNPWEGEARERHRQYAAAAAKTRGGKMASGGSADLTAKTKSNPRQPAQAQIPLAAMVPGESQSALAKRSRAAPHSEAPDLHGKMSLGRRSPPQVSAQTSTGNPGNDQAWRRRLFGH